MAKDRERKRAEELYIREKKTGKEIGQILNVTQKTVGKWIKRYGWKERRAASMSSMKSGVENLNELINLLTEKAIECEKEQADLGELGEKERAERNESLTKQKVGLIDSIAKLNKTKESFEKEHRIPYNVYVNVAEQLMGAMLEELPGKIQPHILEFFEDHINEMALKYK